MSKDMTIGNPSKILFYFAIPMVLGNILQQLYNIVDSMIVGNFVGADALATVVQAQKIRHIFHMCLYFFLYSSDTSSNSSISATYSSSFHIIFFTTVCIRERLFIGSSNNSMFLEKFLRESINNNTFCLSILSLIFILSILSSLLFSDFISLLISEI
ncbi:hypothetical protein FDB92_17880 [Clostridium butyricum]|nr:MATE family efflux transporter [Clostridium butyricum]NFL32999.1 hypothetical protein [Clostridium butyricum]NFS17968.1 hypothetical protein [Clostridium butyricum]